MKIAIHQPRISYYNGGGERVPLEHARYLSLSGHDVTIVTTSAEKKSDIFLDFEKNNPQVKMVFFDLKKVYPIIYKIEAGKNQKRWDDEALAFGKMTKEYYQNNDFDLVAVHYCVDALLIPRNQRVVLHLHGCPTRRRKINDRSLARADSLVSVSMSIAKYWRKMHDIKKRIFLAYNGMDNDNYHPVDIKEEFDIFFLGRLIKIKGVDDIIEAVRILKKNGKNLKVVIAGDGPERKNLQNKIRKLKLDNIKIIGRVLEDNLCVLYNKSRICIFPSTAKEGVLTTMLEAASCARPIITTSCCGMVEFIKNKKNGILVPPHNPEKISLAVDFLLSHPQVRKNIAKQARKDINDFWTWKKRIKELEIIYKNEERKYKKYIN